MIDLDSYVHLTVRDEWKADASVLQKDQFSPNGRQISVALSF